MNYRRTLDCFVWWLIRTSGCRFTRRRSSIYTRAKNVMRCPLTSSQLPIRHIGACCKVLSILPILFFRDIFWISFSLTVAIFLIVMKRTLDPCLIRSTVGPLFFLFFLSFFLIISFQFCLFSFYGFYDSIDYVIILDGRRDMMRLTMLDLNLHIIIVVIHFNSLFW